MNLSKDNMLKRNATLTVYTRTNDRAVANILKWWQSKNENVKSMSELVRISIETLNAILISQGAVEPFEDDHQARMFLKLHNLVKDTMTKKKEVTFYDSVKESVMNESHFDGTLKESLVTGGALTGKKVTKYQLTHEELNAQARVIKEYEQKGFSVPSDKSNEPNDGDLRDESLGIIPNNVKGEE